MATITNGTNKLDGACKAVLDGLRTVQHWPNNWPAPQNGLVTTPAGLWVNGQAEKYIERTGKLHRTG